jgi:enediyne biosynthesis protein E4
MIPTRWPLWFLVFIVSSGPVYGLAGAPLFVESDENTLGFRHTAPLSPERHIHLYMGSGLGWCDIDRDGILDLVLSQGASVETMATANGTPAVSLWTGTSGNFVDDSASAGFTGNAYGMGLTIGDLDNDGFPDLFVTGLFAAALYRNNGDGTFQDITASAGIQPQGLGSGACFTDIDHDGLLDLFYVRYIEIQSLKQYPLCSTKVGSKNVTVGCNPNHLAGEADSVYRNRGDGTFADMTAEAGLEAADKRQGLGIVSLDLDDDGQTEFFVANDTSPNDLWVRTERFQLEEHGLLAGLAVGRTGAPKAGMGIAAGDIDGDLKPELYVTNYFREGNSLFRNEGEMLFFDASEELGVAAPSRSRLGFGVTLADFDNDGWSDYLVANGHVHDHIAEIKGKQEPYAQLPQVLHNRAGRRFVDVSTQAGGFFQKPSVLRGTAAADVDGDGRVDVAVLRLNERAALLRNATAGAGQWLAVELLGTESNRDGIGATVVVRCGTMAVRRDRMSTASYLSCDSPVLHFGLGSGKTVDSITVRWPSGRHEQFPASPMGTRVRLVEGQGTPISK